MWYNKLWRLLFVKEKRQYKKWVQNNREEMFKDSISNSEFEIKAQAENDGLLALRDLPGLRVKIQIIKRSR